MYFSLSLISSIRILNSLIQNPVVIPEVDDTSEIPEEISVVKTKKKKKKKKTNTSGDIGDSEQKIEDQTGACIYMYVLRTCTVVRVP